MRSMTLLLEKLRSDDKTVRDKAAEELWKRCFPVLVVKAKEHLDKKIRRRVDEEALAAHVLASLCLALQAGRYELEDRDDLWKLLLTITFNKARSQAQFEIRERRDIRREEEAGAGNEAGSEQGVLADLANAEPTPEEAMLLTENLERLLNALDDELRQIAAWKLEGYTNAQIAGPSMLDCSERKVERKLQRIRQVWLEQGLVEPPAPRPQ